MKIDQSLSIGVVDCETTGLDPEKDRIVEIGVAKVTLAGVDGTTFSSLFNPGFAIPASASAIHHITDEDVIENAQFSNFDDHCPWRFEILAAHNAEFDSKFLKTNSPMLCTMRLAKKLWPGLESYSNQFLRYHFKLKPQLSLFDVPHRARPDAIVTAEILLFELKAVMQMTAAPPDVESLIRWVNEPILLETVGFGKHKGIAWSTAPSDYLSWILRNLKDADRDTIFTARHYLNRR